MKKELFRQAIFCLGMAMLFSSCGKSKFDEAVELLGSLPVFFDNERVGQTVTYEDTVITLSFSYHPKTSKWANDVIGEEWVPEVFLQELLDNNIAAFTLGGVLNLKNCSPVEEFLSMAKEKNLTFVVKNDTKEYRYSPDEVKKIISDESNKNLAAPYFAKQIDQFAQDLNSELRKVGIYMSCAKMLESPQEGRSICIYINYMGNQMPSKMNPMIEQALELYHTIPIYCHFNKIKLAIQYHLVDNESELTNNEFVDYLCSGLDYNLVADKIFFVSPEKLSVIWESFKKKAEQVENK